MERKYFGTDGVRGEYGGPVINEVFAARLGLAVGQWLARKGRVLIGRDTRTSGASLAHALGVGLRMAGLQPVSLGVLPTPAVARAVRRTDAVLGVVITASHNPASDNGIKFFARTGQKLTDQEEVEIEAKLPPPEAMPTLLEGPDLPVERAPFLEYVSDARGLLPAGSLKGWKIVVDTAHGATVETTPAVLRALGAEVIALGAAPDGRNINQGVGSEHPQGMAAAVREHGAHLGVAHDGDGDRLILCDERGELLDGDEIITLLATQALEFGMLSGNEVVVTVQSNLGVDAAVTAAGGRVHRTQVGDRYVLERMRVSGATLGGESSGHIICADISPTGDGLVALMRVLDVLVGTRKPLSELRQVLKKFPQGSRNLRVSAKRPLADCTSLQAEMTKLDSELGSKGRVLVRFSGTEAKLRLLVEAETQAAVDEGLQRLERAALADLTVV